MTEQMKQRSGEALRRLKEGHAHAEKRFLEKVWWPAIGHFNHLHAEYEIYDFRNGARYIDFAYVRPPYKVGIEIDGYGAHSRDIDRRKFADDRFRQNELVLDGWQVLRFSYDAIEDQSKRCQQHIQQILGKLSGKSSELLKDLDLSMRHREMIRIAIRAPQPITPAEAAAKLRCSDKQARVILKALTDQNLLIPASGAKRIRSYRVHPQLSEAARCL
ncbi:DUF559 domain-containing protein [Paenibacillus sp. NEAU-GSW1]|nr:DUF559 domain-containing protein [Paenibacillus sp. NEAU-GSW1]